MCKEEVSNEALFLFASRGRFAERKNHMLNNVEKSMIALKSLFLNPQYHLLIL